MDSGLCDIKECYVLHDKNDEFKATIIETNKRKSTDDIIETDENNLFDEESKNKNVHTRKFKKRGQNKNRPVYKEDRTLHLCHSLVNGPTDEKCILPNCRYVHNLDEYLLTKGPDLNEECVIFKNKGFCPRGVTCRYSKSHLDENGHNIKSANYDENRKQTTCNGITSELQVRLRKHQYDFSKSKAILKHFEDLREQNLKPNQPHNSIDEKPIGSATDDDETGGRDAFHKPEIDFSNKLVLSPLTTVGNLPFRRICKEFGADITCGEMACAVPLVKGFTQEWALTKRHESEDIFGVQLCGCNPNIITQAAQLLQETSTVDYLDLNIGCPIDLIYQQGGGCALMRRSKILELTVRSCSALSPTIPFTVKMRTGIYADKSVAHDLIPLVEEWGAAAVTLHGRSREQRYTKNSNWEYIEQCASMAKRMPIIGNGDILSFEDYNEKKQNSPHVSSVMIGRGALMKPWIFQEIKDQKAWDPTSSERFNILQKYVNYGLEHWGSDTKGVENTRRFLLEWQSFFYRYVPYGILLKPPQRINQRPPKYKGRDEMETLLSSSNSSDWVKLSELLLGPVPEGFTFVPKHKANAF